MELFKVEDILQAIEDCNFRKAMGPDGFDGSILRNNTDLRNKYAREIKNRLTSGKIPQYLREGRLVALSKNKNT